MKKLLLILFVSLGKLQAQYIPTWTNDIACIVYTRCASCHNPSGIAPFSLIDYNDVVNFSPGIQLAVNSKIMPPWPPDASYRKLAHERILTQQEITLINDWVSNNTPYGSGNAPAAPVFTNNWQISAPDLSTVMPTYTIPNITADLYRCFVMPSNITVDKFINGIEVIPGNRNAVHHVLVYQDVANTALVLDSLDPDPGYTSFGGPGSNTAELLGAWVPGSEPYFTPAGMGIKLKANAHIILQVHYPFGSTGLVDSTRLNLQFDASPMLRTVRVDPILYHNAPVLQNGPLYIPANTIQTFHEKFTLPVAIGPITLLTVGPHMHLIAVNTHAYAVTLLQDTIPFIRIPNWDFHWQGFYAFRNPVKIPAGSTLHSYATYDNTGGNPHNPNNPPLGVSLGEATTDEMMLTYFYWLPYVAGDENIVVDTSTTVTTYNGCTYTTSLQDLSVENVHIGPNPNNGLLNISLPTINDNAVEVKIYNSSGSLVLKQKLNAASNTSTIPLQINNGVYQCIITRGNTYVTKKLVVIN